MLLAIAGVAEATRVHAARVTQCPACIPMYPRGAAFPSRRRSLRSGKVPLFSACDGVLTVLTHSTPTRHHASHVCAAASSASNVDAGSGRDSTRTLVKCGKVRPLERCTSALAAPLLDHWSHTPVIRL